MAVLFVSADSVKQTFKCDEQEGNSKSNVKVSVNDSKSGNSLTETLSVQFHF